MRPLNTRLNALFFRLVFSDTTERGLSVGTQVEEANQEIYSQLRNGALILKADCTDPGQIF